MNRATSARLKTLVLTGALLGLGLACGGGGGSSPSPAPVLVVAPSALVFSSNPAVYTLGHAITTNSPTHGDDCPHGK